MKKLTFENVSVDWKPMVQHWGYARCQTVKTLGKIEPYQKFKLNLNKNKKYRIFIHDPKFFMHSFNPSSAPMISNLLNKLSEKSKTYSGFSRNQDILAEKNILIHRDKSPCRNYNTFSFSDCIINYAQNKTGCKVHLITSGRNSSLFFAQIIAVLLLATLG